MIKVEGLRKLYHTRTGGVAAVSDFTLTLERGERFGLFGPSGCGKTTFLRCLAGLERPEEGRITIAGAPVFDAHTGLNDPPWKRPIGFVFQDYALWPHMTVEENVLFPLRHGRSINGGLQDEDAMARQALHLVRMEGLQQRYPSELSGGQRQRIALARALVAKPHVLLLDEPLSSLDSHLRRQTRNELIGILQETGITTIFVSHDHFDGLFMAHRLGVMRDGRIVQSGIVSEVLSHPADATVAEVLNVGSTIPCSRDEGSGDRQVAYVIDASGQRLMFDGSRTNASIGPGDPCSILIPSGSCRIWNGLAYGDGVQQLTGVAIQEAFTGTGWCVLVRIADSLIEIWGSDCSHVRLGEKIHIAVDASRIQIIPRGR